MSERVEKIMREYPQMKAEAKCLEYQICDFRGISEAEMIESMLYSKPDGERVKTSGLSDKTASIAVSFRERMERINGEWYDYLEKKYVFLSEELRFFESAVRSLPDTLADFTHDLVFERMTWDALESRYHVSRFTVQTYRKKAIAELDRLYAAHDAEVAAYILK